MEHFMFLLCLVFAMSLCESVYMCHVVTCWERADLLALVYHFSIGILVLGILAIDHSPSNWLSISSDC